MSKKKIEKQNDSENFSAKKINSFFQTISIHSSDEKVVSYILDCLKNKVQMVPDKNKWVNGLMTPEGVFLPCDYGVHSNLREFLMRYRKLSESPYPYAPEDVKKFEDTHVNFNDCNWPPYNSPITFRGDKLTPYQKLSIHEWAKENMKNNYQIKQKGYYDMGPDWIIDDRFEVKKREK